MESSEIIKKIIHIYNIIQLLYTIILAFFSGTLDKCLILRVNLDLTNIVNLKPIKFLCVLHPLTCLHIQQVCDEVGVRGS